MRSQVASLGASSQATYDITGSARSSRDRVPGSKQASSHSKGSLIGARTHSIAQQWTHGSTGP